MLVEREVKFDLPPRALRQVRRVVSGAGTWRQRIVSSIYFDTADERLRRAGVALRLRRDGTRRLQTIKAESVAATGFSARAEWELPSPRGRLDVTAFPREEILAATGLDIVALRSRLRPVFETRFARRAATVSIDGATRAEIAVDRGHVAAGTRREPISEIELELMAGEPASLLRYAAGIAVPLGLALGFESKAARGYRLAAGESSPGPRKWRRPLLGELTTPAEAFAAMFNAALAQAGANARGVARGADPEYLHQMRVGLRRLRSALRAFRDLAPKKAAKPLARRLRALMPPLGVARDWDVFCDGLVRISAQEPARSAAMAELLLRARARRAAARKRARQVAASPELQAFLLRALLWIHRAPWKARSPHAASALPAFAARALETLHRKTLKQAKSMDWQEAGQRHRLRIRIKRLRYGCDFFAGSFAVATARPYVRRVAALQDVLGDLNDLAVARRLLAELVPRDSAPAIAAACSRLRRTIAARERKLIAALGPAWAAFEKRGVFWRIPA